MSTKQELMLAYFLSAREIPNKFRAWPLHITIVPWFIPHNNPDEFKKSIQAAVARMRPFVMVVGRQENWHDLTVNVMEHNDRMHRLHDTLLGLVNSRAVSTARQKYVGPDFKPHVTHKSGLQATPGQKIRIDTVSLVSAPVDEPRSSREKQIITQFRLGAQ